MVLLCVSISFGIFAIFYDIARNAGNNNKNRAVCVKVISEAMDIMS